jgi:hypothetical protein
VLAEEERSRSILTAKEEVRCPPASSLRPHARAAVSILTEKEEVRSARTVSLSARAGMLVRRVSMLVKRASLCQRARTQIPCTHTRAHI